MSGPNRQKGAKNGSLRRRSQLVDNNHTKQPALLLAHPHTTMHTANAFAALEVEAATSIQSERQLKELTRPVACTSRTSRRKSQSAKKEAPTQAPTGKFSAKRKPIQTAELSARREPTQTEELSARRKRLTCAAQNMARPQTDNAIPSGHRLQHHLGEQACL